jgi:hypothetical protein
MSSTKSSSVFSEAIKMLVKSVVKLVSLLIAWGLKFTGLALNVIGQTIERIVVKKSS